MTKRLLVDNAANTDNGFDICFRQLSPICLSCISQKPMFQCTMVVTPSVFLFSGEMTYCFIYNHLPLT